MKIMTLSSGAVRSQKFLVDGNVGVELPLPKDVVRQHGTLLRFDIPEGEDYPVWADEVAQLRTALQGVRDWYERDGSVGGCSMMIEECVEPWTKGSR